MLEHLPLTVLVTGAQGYLGGQIMRQGTIAGHTMIGSGRREQGGVEQVDMLNAAAVSNAISRIAPDCIVHAAANVPRTAAEYSDDEASRDSLTMVANLGAAKPRRLILVSSMTVYGAQVTYASEDCLGGAPASAYGTSKREAERFVSESGIVGFCARLPGLFGPPRVGGLVPNLIAALKGCREPALPPAPLQWSAMRVEHAASAIVALLDRRSDDRRRMQALNIGYRGPVSISLMVDYLAQLAQRDISYPIRHPVFEYDLNRFEKITGIVMPSFTDTLRSLWRSETENTASRMISTAKD